MKRYLALVFAAAWAGAAMMVRADSDVQSEVVDGVTWYYRTSQQWNSQTRLYENYAYITSGADKYTGSLTVPSRLGDCPVKSIGNYAFSGCSGLTSVTIPEGVTSIGGYAFRDCSGLTSVTIPSSVTSIGSYAFFNCSLLERFDVPSSVTSIGDHVVRGCASLRTITVADGNVNYKCVNNCIVSVSGTTLVVVPFGCEEVTIPEGVTSIGSYAFYFCSGLTSVTIPSSVTSIGEYAFHNCSGLTSVTIPSSVTSIGKYAFYYCRGLTSVTIPEGVTSIGSDAFYNCSGLKNVTFLGAPPVDVSNSGLLSYGNVSFPRSLGGAWLKVLNDTNKFRGYNRKQPDVAVLSSKIRENDPTILDVVYKVTSSVTNTVKVRVLAFEDGVRSFANVVRPETFVADTNGVETAGNIGDTIAANVEHTLSWKVSADWSNQLAKVSFEVLATEGDLLPLEVRTIPASDQYGKMDVTWNAITESQWFDALLWLYADKDDGIVVEDGVVKRVSDGYLMTYDNATISTLSGRSWQCVNGVRAYYNFTSVPEYVLEKMGYMPLSGDVLNYVNEETRLGLVPSGARQYGYKIVSPAE